MKKNSVKKNFIYNLIYQVVVLLVPLVTTPYVSRVLQSDGVGTYSFILSIVTYFTLFGSLGIAMYGQREIAFVQDDKEKRTKVFFEIIFLRFITIGISLIIYFFIFGRTGNNVLFYRIFALEIVANALDVSWFFQGIEDFKKTVIRNIVFKLLGVLCIFTLVKTKEDLWIYILIYVLANVIGNMSLWLYLPKYLEKIKLKSLNLLRHLKPTISMFIPQIAIQIYTVLDRTMIGVILTDMSEVGYYEQSQKIVKMALALVGAYGTVMCPRYANAAAKNEEDKINEYLNTSFRVAWLMGTALTFGIIGIANNLVPWFFGEGYDKVKILLMVSAPLNLAIGLNNVTGIQYLVQVKKQNVFSVSVIIGACINFFMNIIGIYIFKSVGAAVASVIAEFAILTYQLLYIKKNTSYNIKNVFAMSFKYLISGIIMMIVVILIGFKLPVNAFGTIIQVGIGACVYGIALILLKDEFVMSILNKVIGKGNKILFKEK